MNNKDMYIELMKSSKDFKNVTEKLFIIARLDNNISDDEFYDIKKVYYNLKKSIDK